MKKFFISLFLFIFLITNTYAATSFPTGSAITPTESDKFLAADQSNSWKPKDVLLSALMTLAFGTSRTITGDFVVTGDLTAGDIDTTDIGQTTPGKGAFSTLTYSNNTETLAANKTLTITHEQIQYYDPGGASRNVLLPAEASSAGLFFIIVNTADAAENLTVKEDSDTTTIGIVARYESRVFVCDGTDWKSLGVDFTGTADQIIITYTADNAATLSLPQSIGVTSDVTFGNITSEAEVTLGEIATPTPVANYGKVYTKTDNKLYFQDGAGSEHEIPLEGTYYGEAYIYENTTATDIQAVEQWHPGIGFTTGEVENFTFFTGSSIDILSFADYSGTVAGTIKATTDGSHGYSTGDIISIVGALIEAGDPDPYYGRYEITVVDADEYYFTNANWNATQTAISMKPASLIATVGGKYLFVASGSVSVAAISKTIDIKPFLNTTGIDKMENRLNTKSSGEWSNMSGSGIIDVTAGDTLWFGIKGVTDATNVTMRYGNFSLHRL